MKKCSLFVASLLISSSVFANINIENKLDWSARARYAEFGGDETARAASLLLRATLDTHWTDIFNTTVQLDNVSRGFKSEHSDGVDFNGEPTIPDSDGFDINQLYLGANFESVSIKLGRQRINLDDQRFIGGNGFWQNEQTFDATLGNIKFLDNSQLTYAYIDNVNRIYGEDADKYLRPSDVNYTGPGSLRAQSFLGDHKHNTNILQLDLKEWDYSQVKAYGYFINNKTMPTTSNNTVGGNYAFTYKLDSINYRIKLEAAGQEQPELHDSPVIPYYLADISVGINRFEINGRYEVLGNKDGTTFITPLASGHDFQGRANLISNFSGDGLKDAVLGITWRSAPFKVEAISPIQCLQLQ